MYKWFFHEGAWGVKCKLFHDPLNDHLARSGDGNNYLSMQIITWLVLGHAFNYSLATTMCYLDHYNIMGLCLNQYGITACRSRDFHYMPPR